MRQRSEWTYVPHAIIFLLGVGIALFVGERRLVSALLFTTGAVVFVALTVVLVIAKRRDKGASFKAHDD